MDGPRLEQTDRGLTVFYQRYLYSKRDPSRRPISVVRNAPVEARCLYFIPSPLLGYGLSELLERIPEDSRILAVEAAQELFKTCSPQIPNKVLNHPRVMVVRLADRISMESVIDELGPWNFRRVIRLDLSAGVSLQADIYDDLYRFAMDKLAAYWRNRHALRIFGRQWIKHLYANLLKLDKAADLEPTEKPVIVLGAGPSLEDSLEFLKKVRADVRLWATDTALGTLIGADIVPDLVCVLETQAWNHLDFHGAEGSGIRVLADLSSYPNSIAHTGGPFTFYSSQFAHLEFLNRLRSRFPDVPPVPALGSVGLAAVHLALEYSSGPVLLAGVDFAYNPGKTHAVGSAVHKWQLSRSSRCNPLPGWKETMERPRIAGQGADGVSINSDVVLMGYAKLFRDRFGENSRLKVLYGGLDLGLPVIDTEEAELMIEAAARRPGTKFTVPDRPSNRETRNPAATFLKTELQSLAEAVQAWNFYAEGGCTGQSVAESLKKLDQVYCDFPDEPPLPKTNDSFLVRAVTRCRELHRYIGRLLEED